MGDLVYDTAETGKAIAMTPVSRRVRQLPMQLSDASPADDARLDG
jgi:hypothetical protein